MTKFYPKFYITLGSLGNSSFYVKDSNGDWREFANYEYFKVTKRLNQVSEFEVSLVDIQDAEKVYFKEFAEVMFFSENTLILKGRIQKINYETAYGCTATGFGMEALLLDNEFIKSGDKRVQYDSTSAQTIAKQLLSDNSDGISPFIMQPNTTGIFDTDYGTISMRYEYATRLNALAKLAEALDYEWWVSQDGGFIDYFNIAPYQPSTTAATVSQQTFTITGASANCESTEYEKDIENMANYISCLGYGDGINQLKTTTYNASATYSTLNEDLTSSDTTITISDASSFPTSGEIRIAEERITYTGKSTNDLTGCTRGANETTAVSHKKGVYLEKYVAYTSPESSSSIGTNGLMDFSVVNKDLLDRETAELIASNELLSRMNPIVRIKLVPNEPIETVRDRKIGELITITDAESSLSGDYRIVGMTYTSDYGNLSLEIEASNKSLTFIEQMQKQKQAEENISKYMQGATNIYAINSAENCDATHYLNMRFFVPNEAIAINKVLLNFKLKDFRSYTSVSDSNSEVSAFDFDNKVTVGAGTIGSTGVWVDEIVGNMSANSTDRMGQWFIGSILAYTNGAFETISTRIYDVTSGEYFPDSTGNQYHVEVTDETAPIVIYVPKNCKNHHFHLQAKRDFTTGNNYATIDTWGVSTHTHSISGTISEETLTSPSVDLYVGEDDGSMDLVGTYTTDQTEIDLTDVVKTVGAGKWIDIQFRPNKNMRIEADTIVQIFIESK